MKVIKLSNSIFKFIVDDEDFERTEQETWILSDGDNISAEINFRRVTLGRFILNYSGPLNVDHINRNRFNNKKSNLRLATVSQNQANKTAQENNTSGYKGVFCTKNGKKWQAKIRINRLLIHLGTYASKENAARVYNEAAIKYFGEFAFLNKLN